MRVMGGADHPDGVAGGGQDESSAAGPQLLCGCSGAGARRALRDAGQGAGGAGKEPARHIDHCEVLLS